MTQRMTEAEKSELFNKAVALFDKGLSPKEVAKELGTSSSYVFKIVQGHGHRIARKYFVEPDAELMKEYKDRLALRTKPRAEAKKDKPAKKAKPAAEGTGGRRGLIKPASADWKAAKKKSAKKSRRIGQA